MSAALTLTAAAWARSFIRPSLVSINGLGLFSEAHLLAMQQGVCQVAGMHPLPFHCDYKRCRFEELGEALAEHLYQLKQHNSAAFWQIGGGRRAGAGGSTWQEIQQEQQGQDSEPENDANPSPTFQPPLAFLTHGAGALILRRAFRHLDWEGLPLRCLMMAPLNRGSQLARHVWNGSALGRRLLLELLGPHAAAEICCKPSFHFAVKLQLLQQGAGEWAAASPSSALCSSSLPSCGTIGPYSLLPRSCQTLIVAGQLEEGPLHSWLPWPPHRQLLKSLLRGRGNDGVVTVTETQPLLLPAAVSVSGAVGEQEGVNGRLGSEQEGGDAFTATATATASGTAWDRHVEMELQLQRQARRLLSNTALSIVPQGHWRMLYSPAVIAAAGAFFKGGRPGGALQPVHTLVG